MRHCSILWDELEQAWQRTVQAVPPDRKVLVTSDHRYIFLGSGLSDPGLKGADRVLEGKRSGFSSRAKRSRQAARDYGWMPTGGWPYWRAEGTIVFKALGRSRSIAMGA